MGSLIKIGTVTIDSFMYEYYYAAVRVQIITDGKVSQADIVEIANGMKVFVW